MLYTAIPLLATLALPSLAHPLNSTVRGGSNAHTTVQRCGTGPPTTDLREAHTTMHRESRIAGRKAQKANEVIVDTYIHFVTTFDQASQYTPETLAGIIANQSGVLNSAYASSNITFHMHPYTKTINDGWATDQNDTDMKHALRRGSYAALNIYFQTNLSSGVPVGAQASNQLLGYSTLPQSVTYTPTSCPSSQKNPNGSCKAQAYPASTYVLDGCNVLAGSMPNGGLQGYQMGKTAVHEVGHWFGLLHTFQDNSCAAGDPGDYVDDTPQEAVSTDGCPSRAGVTKDSCPNSLGVDPVNNYMDYSNDECYTGFSPMQQTRMLNMFNLFRRGN